MDQLHALVSTLLHSYVRYDGGSLVIISDDKSNAIAQAMIDVTLERNVPPAKRLEIGKYSRAPLITNINIDRWRSRGLLPQLPRELGRRIDEALCEPDIQHNTLIYLALGHGEEVPMRKAINAIAEAKGKVGGLPSCTLDVLQAGLHSDNNPRFVDELYERLVQERALRVTCDRGTDLIAEFDTKRYDWVKSDGILIPGKYANPIPAKVFTHPANIDGWMVVSGSFGPLIGRYAGRHKELVETLDRTPMTWRISGGRITDVVCDDPTIQSFARKYILESDVPHSDRIGEFGMPANLHVLARPLTGNLMIDEKGRFHLASGDGYQNRTRCEYICAHHGDGLLANATVSSGRTGNVIMSENQYNPRIFKTLKESVAKQAE